MNFDFSNLVKDERHKHLTFLDTTPDNEQPTYNVLGPGITELAISYNPSVDSEKWIVEAASRHIHSSNEKNASVSQTIYLGDPCYEFVEAGRDKLNYKTNILDVNMSKKVDGDKFYAELTAGMITVTSYLGEEATIEYDLYYEGDKVIGSVDVSSGKPVFTPNPDAVALANAKKSEPVIKVESTSSKKVNEEF